MPLGHISTNKVYEGLKPKWEALLSRWNPNEWREVKKKAPTAKEATEEVKIIEAEVINKEEPKQEKTTTKRKPKK